MDAPRPLFPLYDARHVLRPVSPVRVILSRRSTLALFPSVLFPLKFPLVYAGVKASADAKRQRSAQCSPSIRRSRRQSPLPKAQSLAPGSGAAPSPPFGRTRLLARPRSRFSLCAPTFSLREKGRGDSNRNFWKKFFKNFFPYILY